MSRKEIEALSNLLKNREVLWDKRLAALRKKLVKMQEEILRKEIF